MVRFRDVPQPWTLSPSSTAIPSFRPSVCPSYAPEHRVVGSKGGGCSGPTSMYSYVVTPSGVCEVFMKKLFCAALTAALLIPVPGSLGAQVNPDLFNGLRYRNVGPSRGGRVTAVTGVAPTPSSTWDPSRRSSPRWPRGSFCETASSPWTTRSENISLTSRTQRSGGRSPLVPSSRSSPPPSTDGERYVDRRTNRRCRARGHVGLQAGERNKVRFIHLNHTNPALRSNSAARAEIARSEMHVAEQGERLDLTSGIFLKRP